MTSRENSAEATYDVAVVRDYLIQLPVIFGGLALACQSIIASNEKVCSSITAIFCTMRLLCNSLHINMELALRRKIHLNGLKYREQDVKDGSCEKYTSYTDKTGISLARGQSTIDLLVPDKDVSSTDNSKFTIALPDIAEELRSFNCARGWTKSHTLRNLVLCLAGEIGELVELFQWEKDTETILEKEKIDKSSQEIADICIYLLNLVTACNIDINDVCHNLKESRKEDLFGIVRRTYVI